MLVDIDRLKLRRARTAARLNVAETLFARDCFDICRFDLKKYSPKCLSGNMLNPLNRL